MSATKLIYVAAALATALSVHQQRIRAQPPA
jgi:hypothetical protein